MGVTAHDLLGHLVERGFNRRQAQFAVQRALDRGAIHLGAKMRLFVATKAAA